MTNPLLAVTTQDGESELKDYIIEYVGTKLNTEEVTVQMVSQTLAAEFPEFLYAYAEENFLRGYERGLNDGTNMFNPGEADDGSTE